MSNLAIGYILTAITHLIAFGGGMLVAVWLMHKHGLLLNDDFLQEHQGTAGSEHNPEPGMGEVSPIQIREVPRLLQKRLRKARKASRKSSRH